MAKARRRCARKIFRDKNKTPPYGFGKNICVANTRSSPLGRKQEKGKKDQNREAEKKILRLCVLGWRQQTKGNKCKREKCAFCPWLPTASRLQMRLMCSQASCKARTGICLFFPILFLPFNSSRAIRQASSVSHSASNWC